MYNTAPHKLNYCMLTMQIDIVGLWARYVFVELVNAVD